MMKRIGEINRPILEPISLIGKVMQIWGPKRFNPTPQYKCRLCEHVFEQDARFPYEHLSPAFCTRCGSRFRGGFEQLPCSVRNTRLLYKVHLREGTTDYTLILLDNETPPIPGDVIVFPAWAMPKLKGKSPIIRAWTGEATEFAVFGSEHSSEVIGE